MAQRYQTLSYSELHSTCSCSSKLTMRIASLPHYHTYLHTNTETCRRGTFQIWHLSALWHQSLCTRADTWSLSSLPKRLSKWAQMPLRARSIYANHLPIYARLGKGRLYCPKLPPLLFPLPLEAKTHTYTQRGKGGEGEWEIHACWSQKEHTTLLW